MISPASADDDGFIEWCALSTLTVFEGPSRTSPPLGTIMEGARFQGNQDLVMAPDNSTMLRIRQPKNWGGAGRTGYVIQDTRKCYVGGGGFQVLAKPVTKAWPPVELTPGDASASQPGDTTSKALLDVKTSRHFKARSPTRAT